MPLFISVNVYGFRAVKPLKNQRVANVGNYGKEDRKPARETKQDTGTAGTKQRGIAMNYKQYFDKCHGQLNGTSYHTARGISGETCDRFNIGYDDDLTVYGGSWDALIVPTGDAGFIAINTADSHAKRKGKTHPFNISSIQQAQRPVFVVNDIIDALSIIEAGGEAIALELTDRADELTAVYIKHFKGREIPQPLILALEHYAEAQELGEELDRLLTSDQISHYTADLELWGVFIPPEELGDRITEAEELAEPFTKQERETYIKQSAYSHIDEFLDGISDSANTPAISTGFNQLDRVLDGGLYEGLYICGAVTSLGKTTLIMQIADQIAGQGRDVLIFSLEMSRAELMSKSISRLTLLETKRTGGDTRDAKTARGITDGARYQKYSDRERELIRTAVNEYRNTAQHIYIHEGIGDITTDFIRATLNKHIKYTSNTPVIVVDYVQILAPHDQRATDKQNTDRNITELKRISRDYKTPVIGVSSFNRDNYNGAVNFRAFKESGAIEYGSDVLMGLQLQGAGKKNFDTDSAIKEDPRAIELVILKNRQGKIGERVPFKYYPLFNYFEEDGAPDRITETATRVI